jgi:hypothetical protein
MSEHQHVYKVTADSVFGLIHVNAVMQCTGAIDNVPCKASLVKLLKYSELEKKGDKRPTYFYREQPVREVANGRDSGRAD